MLFFQYVFGHILAVEKEEDRQLNVGIGMQPAQDGHCGQSSKWLPSTQRRGVRRHQWVVCLGDGVREIQSSTCQKNSKERSSVGQVASKGMDSRHFGGRTLHLK